MNEKFHFTLNIHRRQGECHRILLIKVFSFFFSFAFHFDVNSFTSCNIQIPLNNIQWIDLPDPKLIVLSCCFAYYVTWEGKKCMEKVKSWNQNEKHKFEHKSNRSKNLNFSSFRITNANVTWQKGFSLYDLFESKCKWRQNYSHIHTQNKTNKKNWWLVNMCVVRITKQKLYVNCSFINE